MAAASLLVPPALLAAAAVLTWGLGLAGVRVGRWLAAAGAWLSLAALLGIWGGSGRAILELNLSPTLGEAPLSLRLGPVAAAFGLFVLLPSALLLTFQERSWQESGIAALAACASVATTEAGSALLTALTLGACASLVLLALLQEQARAAPGYWFGLTVVGLLLLWAGAVLDVTGGTSVYSAAPVTALRVPVFVLVAAAGVLCAGLVPARTWVSEVWRRPRLQAGTLAVALVVPLGFMLLVRAYELGAGRWPSPWLNLAMAALGTATAAAAALRAQAADSRRGFLAEAVPLSGGLALLGLALGTPFGVIAAAVTLSGSALLAGLVPLLPSTRQPVAVLGLAVAVGVPPALVFAGRLLPLQAAVEAGEPTAFLALAAAGAWLLGIAAAARAVRLPEQEEPSAKRLGMWIGVALALLGGAGLGGLQTLLALPLAVEALGAPASAVSGGYGAVTTPSGGWSALTLGGPLLVLAVAAAFFSRRLWKRWPHLTGRMTEPPAPFFELPLGGAGDRLADVLGRVKLPPQYRSLLDPAGLEAAMARSRPWFWAAATAALIVAVTR